MELTRNGYKVLKSAENELLKKQLTVKPYVPTVFVKPQFVKPYKVYHETENYLYLPKQFGIGKFGIPPTDNCSLSYSSSESLL